MVLTMVPTKNEAKRISRFVIERKLAACANIVGDICSCYRWKGKVVEDTEFLLVMKTTKSRFKELQAGILAKHPYEVPEIVALEITQGSRPYIEWIKQETAVYSGS